MTNPSVHASLRWLFIAKLASQLINWSVTFAVLHILDPSDYGLMAIASMFVSFLTIFADMGLSVAVIQAKEINNKKIAEVFGAILLLNFVLFILMFSLAPFAANFFDEQRLTTILQVLGCQFLIGALISIPRATLQREMRFRIHSIIEVSGTLVSALVTLFMAWAHHGVWSLVVGSLVGGVWQCVWVNMVVPPRSLPHFNFIESRQLLGFGGKVTLIRILWHVLSQADIFIVGKFLGKDALGIYSVAIQLSTMPMNKMMGIINQVALSAFSRIQDDKSKIKKDVLSGSIVISFITFPLFLGMSSLAPELVEVFLGSKWEKAVILLQLLPLILPLRMLSSYLSTAAQGIGRPDIDLRNTMQGVLVMPPAFFIGSQFGIIGVALAWLITIPFFFVINTRRLLVGLYISNMEFYKQLIKPFTLALVMCAGIFLARKIFNVDIEGLHRLFALTGIGVLVYFGFYFLFWRKDVLKIIGIIKN